MYSKKILVIGEVCQDLFIYGDANYRLNPEAPAPVFKPLQKSSNLGMAGNTFKNLLSIQNHYKENIHFFNIYSSSTIKKTRFIDKKSGQMIMRMDSNDRVSRIKRGQLENLKTYDLVIVSDYDKGFLTHEDLNTIAARSKICILDTKKREGSVWVEYFDFIKINEAEEKNNKLLKENVHINTIVTLGERGCRYNGLVYPIKEKKIENPNVAGAGDTFLAGFAYQYVLNNRVIDSLNFANHCAYNVVNKRGVSVPF